MFMSMTRFVADDGQTPAGSTVGNAAMRSRRELILYATPGGEFGEACDRFFAEVAASGRSTTAQSYPPHVSLTGFFRRPPVAVERLTLEVQAAIAAAPRGPVAVDPIARREGWLGVEIKSDWLLELASLFAARHRLEHGDDPIRLKDWLHMSLAYGEFPVGTGAQDYLDQAQATIAVNAPARWSVGLWERRDSDWIRHR